MKIWDDFIRKEDLEICPGIFSTDRINALTLNTYLVHTGELINDGINTYPDIVSEHMEDVMADIFISCKHIIENRCPEPDEISTYLKQPENAETLKILTSICINADPAGWPETEKRLRETIPMKELDKINWDSDERIKNAEKWQEYFRNNRFREL